MLRWLFKGQSEYQKFVILASARTGSTWLHTLLNSHPQILSKGEIIREKNCTLGEVFNAQSRGIKAVGCKIFMDDPRYETAINELITRKDIKIIFLTRKNKVAQFASLKIAQQDHKWSGQASKESVIISTSELATFIKNQKNFEKIFPQRFHSHQTISIHYEELLESPDSTTELIQKFIHVRLRRLFSLLKRQGDQSYAKRITNWQEIKSLMN